MFSGYQKIRLSMVMSHLKMLRNKLNIYFNTISYNALIL